MQRRILIIDDHDDLASALTDVFSRAGHQVTVARSRHEGLLVPNFDDYDLVITDLDVEPSATPPSEGGAMSECLPEPLLSGVNERIKAFKICATNFRRDEFDEAELKDLVSTILDYKIKFVDKVEYVQGLHEAIEFELPSALSLMHLILDYLMKRVERLGVIKPENSNLFVALDEAFVNAVKHGNKFDAAKLVRITADVTRKEARFTVEDEGEGFDVNSIPDPLDPENLFKASGRGVLFIFNIMDEVQYNERGNRLTMVKKSDSNEHPAG